MPSMFQPAADALGLTLNPPDAGFYSPFDVSGVRRDHFVRVHRDPLLRQLRTEVYLRRPLDLGLRVAPAGQLGFAAQFALRRLGALFSRVFGARDLQVGDASLDEALEIHGDEEGRVAPLLEPMREPLLAWHASNVAFDIDDARVSVRRQFSLMWGDSEDSVGVDVDPALELASRLEQIAATLPVATALASQAAAAGAFVQRRGLASSTTPLCLWGTLDGLAYWAHAARLGPEQFAMETSFVPTAGSLRCGGAVRSATSADTKKRALTGDAGFDAAFVVEGEALAAALPAEARDALGELRRIGHDVRLGDRGLQLRQTLGPAAYEFEPCADRAVSALRAVEGALRKSAAYR